MRPSFSPLLSIPAGTLTISSYGQSYSVAVQSFMLSKTPATVEEWKDYLARYHSRPYGCVIFRPDGSVRMVARGRSKNETKRNADTALAALRANGETEFTLSKVKKLVPTYNSWVLRFAAYEGWQALRWQRFEAMKRLDPENTLYKTDALEWLRETPTWKQSAEQFLYERSPVVFVNWFEAAGFADDGGNRLPTEFEWHWAALGGRNDAVYATHDGKITPDMSAEDVWKAVQHVSPIWNPYGLQRGTISVSDMYEGAAERINGYGLIDMSGNVFEWTATRWYPHYHELIGNPYGIRDHFDMIAVRGGSWAARFAEELRIDERRRYDLKESSLLVGLRFARDAA